ncbi:MAG: DEAD/DEAH box helicase, partial [Desulfobacterales bacterium]|nr:DEAD/DEAH box helicase [Desulfobacterales bacterium]
FVHLDRIARAVDADDQVEYWKSSAYPLNLMDDYKFKRKFEEALSEPDTTGLANLLIQAQRHLLSWDAIHRYQAIDPGNARLRALWQDSVETGNWQLLWMPPSLPYYQPNGPFSDVQPEGCTKTLVFSAWRLVPKAIAMLLSYEAERQMLEGSDRNFAYAELTDKRKPLLTFTRSRGRLTGMPVFCLIYPCLTLAQNVDPLTIARGLNGATSSSQAVFEIAKAKIRELLDEAKAHVSTKESRRPDERWYWAAMALLDRHFHRQDVEHWVSMEDEPLAWGKMLDEASMDGSGKKAKGEARRFTEHVEEFRDFFQNLGRRPEDTSSHPAVQLRFEGFF